MSSSPLRIWPGVAIVAAVWLSRFGAPVIDAAASTEFLVRVLGGLVGGAAIVAWWLFFSRAPWAERLGVVGLLIAALASAWLAGDKSIPVWILWYSAPLLGLALVGAWWRRVARIRAPPRDDSCGHPLDVRRSDTRKDRRRNRQRRRALHVAMDRDAGGSPLGSGRRGGAAACSSVGKSSCVGSGSRRTEAGRRAAVAGELARHVETGQAGRSRAVRELARVPRSRSHWSHPRPADRHRLVVSSPDRAVAPERWPRLVVVRDPRRHSVHPGTARQRGSRQRSPGFNRCARVAPR